MAVNMEHLRHARDVFQRDLIIILVEDGPAQMTVSDIRKITASAGAFALSIFANANADVKEL